MASSVRQPLKWPGGKNYLASFIISKMPPHLNYVEPYFGGGAVLLARDPNDERLWLPPHKGVSEVVNDLNKDLSWFWQVLQGGNSFQEFLRLCEATPFSGLEFSDARLELQEWPEPCVEASSPVVRAWRFFVLCRQSLAGRGECFTAITKARTRSRMNNEVSAWLSAVEGLPEVHARLKRVLILPPTPALDVIRKFDAPQTLFYLDPPYLHETRETTKEYGAFEMSANDHSLLLATLGNEVAGKFMLSGYRSTMYDLAAKMYGWTRHDHKIVNQASHKRKKEVKTECLWTNF